MEKIRINAINKKPCASGGEIVIVKYSLPTAPGIFAEATLNTKWQAQEVDYLEKDVGIGGECSVLIVQKGDYTNITKVDFDSAKKNTTITASEKVEVTTNCGKLPQPSLMSVKDIMIVSQCLTKVVYSAPDITAESVLETYNYFIGKLS